MKLGDKSVIMADFEPQPENDDRIGDLLTS